MESGSSLLGNIASKVKNIDGKLVDCLNSAHEDSDNGSKKSASFALIFKENTTKKIVQTSELRNDEFVQGADVAIPLAAVDEISDRFGNTIYGYFIGKRLTFHIVEN
ncbi:hypothetical protein Tco_1232247 [Tanacetum coccineum]